MNSNLLASPNKREVNYTTQKGDVVDALCFQHYGEQRSDLVNALFRRNPVLSRQKGVLPAGIRIVFPIATRKPETTKLASIWITPSNVAKLRQEQTTKVESAKAVASPTQADVDAFLVNFRALKAEGKITVPESPVFIPSYYTSGESGINDPFVPLADPILNLL